MGGFAGFAPAGFEPRFPSPPGFPSSPFAPVPAVTFTRKNVTSVDVATIAPTLESPEAVAFADAMSTSEMTTLVVTSVTVSADPVAGAINGRFDAV
jgi:hypothetical protein